MHHHGFGGEGARTRQGHDCFSNFWFKVSGAKIKGHAVTLFSFRELLVNFAPPTMI
jgi:hypothetical protein